MNFSSRDINRIIRSPKGQIALAMGDVSGMERVARRGRDEDDEYELRRLLSQYGRHWVKPLFAVRPPDAVRGNPLRHKDWILGNANPKHPNYKVLERLFATR